MARDGVWSIGIGHDTREEAYGYRRWSKSKSPRPAVDSSTVAMLKSDFCYYFGLGVEKGRINDEGVKERDSERTSRAIGLGGGRGEDGGVDAVRGGLGNGG